MCARIGFRLSYVVFALIAAGALAGKCRAQSMDLGIVDEATYSEAIGAIGSSEFVLYDYRRSPRPRIAGVVACLMEFATRNPLADQSQLLLYAQTLSASWQAGAPGDSELRRSANFLPVLRFSRVSGVSELEGFDTAVGKAASMLLGVDVPGPVDFTSLKSRMVRYDMTRGRAFANAPQLSHLLVLGLLGHDLDGVDNPGLAGALHSYLESEGYEPVPDGVDDERFAAVYAGLAQLPADYAAFVAAITVPVGQEAPPIWNGIAAQFDVINLAMDAQLVDLQDANKNGPNLLEGVAMGSDPQILDQLSQELHDRLDIIATPNTILAGNTLLMFQSQDPSVREFAHQAEITAALQADGYDAVAIGIASAKILGSVAMIGVGIATGWTGVGILTAVGGFFIAVEGGFQLAGELDGGAPSNIESQMFEQIINVRQDIENMRAEMHMRFDRIEEQLNVMFMGMATGFNALGMAVGQLQDSVENLSRDLMINRSLLERLEDALYGLAQDLLDADLANRCNNYLDYRGSNGVDLPYAGPESFLDGANEFFTVAVDIAQNTTFAGPASSTLSVASAQETLNGASIGRNVNDLRNFPFNALGLPRLLGVRLVAPAPWAQGAAAYSQFARENPWYFAYQYEQQTLTRGTLADVDLVIQHGENLMTAMSNGRNQALFDELFDGYNESVETLQSAISARLISTGVLPSYWSNGLAVVDPLAGIHQDLAALARVPEVEPNMLPLTEPKQMWDLFHTNAPRLWAIVNPDNEFSSDPPRISWFATRTNDSWQPPNPADPLHMEFSAGTESSQNLGCLSWVFVERDIRYTVVGAASDNGMIASAWSAGPLRDALLSGENLAGQVMPLPPPPFTPFKRSAAGWLNAIGSTPDVVCLDATLPGIAGAASCLSGATPVVRNLSGGQVTIRVLNAANNPLCTVSDSATPPAVSDVGPISGASRAIFEFNPPISAFYTYYGSLEAASTVTLTAYDSMGAVIGSDVRFRENPQAGAVSHGFISSELVTRIEITTNDAGLAVGAFTGLAPFEPSLGVVNIPGYAGPAGANVQADFACHFGPLPEATMTITSDSHEFSDACENEVEADLAEFLFSYADPCLAEIASQLQAPGTNLMKSAAGALSDWEALIEAYATFSLPGAMEYSTPLRAALGGNPNTSELRIGGASVLPIVQQMQLGEISTQAIPDILLERSDIARNEINTAIAAPAQPHPYLSYMLSELRDLRDNVFNLAADDSYATLPGVPLVVSAMDGLMRNDTQQPCRSVNVDVMYAMQAEYIPPQHGSIAISSDGAFTYTPADPEFAGTDSFTYRIAASVMGLGCQPGLNRGELDQFVYSNPATVVILVTPLAPPPHCAGNANGDGIVNFDDISAVIANWLGAGPQGDANNDGVVNFDDISSVIANWLSVCP